MKKMNNEIDRYMDIGVLLEGVDDDEFGIGQGYSKVPDKKIVCRLCGYDRFIVGTGDCHTSIKCPNCLYELTIHEG